MNSVQQHYNQNVDKLKTELKLDNVMQVPKLEKIVINMGVGKNRDQDGLIESLQKDLAAITGQKPITTKAAKAIAGFKVQKGQPVGLKVTLRARRMYHFLDRLINAVLPAIRDFKGLPVTAIDQHGNLNIGLQEHTLFPEIGFEQIGKAHGLQVTVVPSAKNREGAIALYKTLGIPIRS